MSLAPLVTDTMLSAGISLIRFVSLGDQHPEIDPGVDRQPVSWIINGQATNTRPIVFKLPRGTYRYVGYWSQYGSYLGCRVVAPVRMTRPGTFTVHAGDLVEDLTDAD